MIDGLGMGAAVEQMSSTLSFKWTRSEQISAPLRPALMNSNGVWRLFCGLFYLVEFVLKLPNLVNQISLFRLSIHPSHFTD